MDLRRQQRNWEMLQQQLGAEARGEPPRVFSSTRTLFGIRSTVEQQLDAFVAKEEARKKAEREAAVAQGRGNNAQSLEEENGNRSHCED
jgi:hypothetical protein